MATEFPERFFLLIHLRTSQNKSFVRKHLSRQIFDAATLSLGVGESAFVKSLSAKRHAQHSPQSGRWLFFGSFSMSGYLLIVDRIPSYHHLSLFQNCAHFSRACIRIFRVLVCCPKSLWKSWWFKLSGFNQSNSVSEFLLILGLPSLGVEQNRQPLLRLRFKESVRLALSHRNQWSRLDVILTVNTQMQPVVAPIRQQRQYFRWKANHQRCGIIPRPKWQ